MPEPFWIVLLAGWISIWDILRILIVMIAASYLIHVLMNSYFLYQTKHRIDVHNHITTNSLRDSTQRGTPQIHKDDK